MRKGATIEVSCSIQFIPYSSDGRTKGESLGFFPMEESRKRLIGLMAAILTAMHMQRADDLFRMPNGSPITDRIMQRIDNLYSK